MSSDLLLIAVPLLPLVAAAGALVLGNRLPWRGGELVVGAFALSLCALIPLHGTDAAVSTIWFEAGDYRLTVGLVTTDLTWFVALVVAVVSLGVGSYALGYMADKPDRSRFFAELGLFVGAMMALVLSTSLILFFAAWELVGLASYLLIGFRYDEAGAPAAATKAFLMTRIGDVGLLLGWLLVLGSTGTSDIAVLLDAVRLGAWAPSFTTLVALLFLAGAVGKSAQLPLSAWLPDAMIGPTPVSALLHSATMVAAGVFLVLRFYPLFVASPPALSAVLSIGALTALLAAFVATAEMDLKRVLAWSTISQLGEMMIALGLGGAAAAAFHLATHATFKSTLFLAAGSVQEQAGTRDLLRLGGLFRKLPLTGLVFGVAALSLAGVPPLSGFWSEEAILSAAARAGIPAALLIVLLGGLSGAYIGRATAATFLGSRRSRADAEIREASWPMRVGMIALAVVAAALGWLLAGPFSQLLPIESLEPGWTWRVVAVAVSVAGLALGATAGLLGASAPLGRFPQSLAAGLYAATRIPALGAIAAANVLVAVEHRLDRGAQIVAQTAEVVAAVNLRIERGLDLNARRSAWGVWRLALQTEDAETRGFGRGGNRIAASLAAGGQRLGTVQSGKLYLYTLGLFVWATVLVVAGVALFVSARAG